MTGTDREAMSPHQAIADAIRGWVEPDHTDPDPKIEAALVAACAADVEVALAAAGYQVVPDNLVQAATETAETRPAIWSDDEFMLRHAAATKRLAAALAQYRGADPMDVFKGGA